MKSTAHSFFLNLALMLAGLLLAAQLALAVEPFTVSDIRVEGLQRVEPGTVFASLPLRVGDEYDDDKGAAAIRALYGLGVFSDVRLQIDGTVLVVVVQERPSVSAIEFAGNREFDDDRLKAVLRDIGVTPGRPYDKALLDRAEQEIKSQYVNRSLYGAEVVTTVTPVQRNQVKLTFNITEGRPAKITDIHIIGNQAFSEKQLTGLFDLDTGGWLSWYTKSDRYSRSKLNADLEALRSFYLARGYLNFNIDSTQVAISPDKESISITVNITEGDRFVVSRVALDGDYLDRKDEFKSLVRIKPGEAYNADEVAETVQAFIEHFGTYGFAFASVDAVPQVDQASNQVAVILRADPQRRVYVRHINIQGNTRTRDEVIRREFRQYESSWYDAEKIRLSRDRVDRLGYFTQVAVETSPVPGALDQVDLDVTVEERPTGSISLGAGFSSAEKLSLTFGLSQENAFGSGNRLDLQVNTGKFNRTFNLSTTDPYFTINGVSRTVDLYYLSQRPYQDQGGNYRLVTMGAGLKFGLPVTEIDTVYVGMNAEQTEIKPGTNIPAAYLSYANQFGYTSTSFPFTLGWSRDSRDSALVPNEGRYQRLSGELSLMGDAKYVKAGYQYQQYVPLSKKYTLAFNGEVGWGEGLGSRPFPVFKNYFSGGLGSVRGYDQGTLGPRDITGAYVGGTRKFTFSTEFMTPFPGAGNDRTLRLFGFVDVGALYGEDEKISSDRLRYSTGVGLSWISPLGPLRFSYAAPLRKRPGDRTQRFQFQIGTSF